MKVRNGKPFGKEECQKASAAAEPPSKGRAHKDYVKRKKKVKTNRGMRGVLKNDKPIEKEELKPTACLDGGTTEMVGRGLPHEPWWRLALETEW